MSELHKYGNVLKNYVGLGFVTLSTGGPLNCSFEAAQFSDGIIRAQFLVYSKDNSEFHKIPFGAISEVTAFNGTTEDSQQVRLGGQLFTTNWQNQVLAEDDSQIKLTLIAGEMSVTSNAGLTPSKLRFGVTNLHLDGNKSREFKSGDSEVIDHGLLVANLPVGEIRIERIPDYEPVMANIEAVNGSDVTCELSLKLPDGQNTEEMGKAIDIVCNILSIAKGTRISWVYYDVCDANESRCSTYHRSAVTRPYAGRSAACIADVCGADLQLLLERAYVPFVELDEVYSLRSIIACYLESKSPGPYLESKGLAAIQAMELLVGTYARVVASPAWEFVVEESLFDSKAEEISAKIGPILRETFPTLDTNRVNALNGKDKVKEFNRRSFRSKLNKMCKQYKLSLKDIDELITIRNNLVHRACLVCVDQQFPSDLQPSEFNAERIKRYHILIAAMDRLLLTLLGYDGYITDCTQNWARVKINQSAEPKR